MTPNRLPVICQISTVSETRGSETNWPSTVPTTMKVKRMENIEKHFMESRATEKRQKQSYTSTGKLGREETHIQIPE